MIFILLQPLGVILLDGVSPAGVDLSGCVLPFLQALVSKKIAQMSFFRVLDYGLSQLWRNEDDAAVASEHDISRHHQHVTDAGRRIDAHHGGIQKLAGLQRAIVVRWVVEADKSNEVRQFIEAIDVPYSTVVHNAVSRPGIDRIADIVADRRSGLFQPKVIAGVDIAILQHVHRPCVH